MAIGFDGALQGRGRSPLAPARPAPQQQTPSYGAMPPMISDAAVQSVTNNQRAQAAGSARGALTESDRAGMSRGRGQQYAANIAEAAADAQARNAAAQTEMDASSANASARQAYDMTMRGEQLGNSGLLEGLRNANAMARWQRRDYGQNINEAMRRGQFGMDSIQPDYTPFLGALLQD